MRIGLSRARVSSDITVDDDIDFLGLYQVKNLAVPAASEALKKGYAGIINADIAAGAAIVYSKLSLALSLLAADIKAAEFNVANKLVKLNASADVPLAQIPDTLTGKDADTLDGLHASELIGGLLVLIFQSNPATGTCDSPERINDNSTTTRSQVTTVGHYAEVDWVLPLQIKQFRQWGDTANTGDGRWKIQYWDGAAWQDWETAIPVRTLSSWGDWVTPAAGVKTTTKIRLVCTTVDGGGTSNIKELEIKY